MKIVDLTHDQLTTIFVSDPDWVALNRYRWAVENRPEWMCENYPIAMTHDHIDLMRKYNPDWLSCHRVIDTKPTDVPEEIANLITQGEKQ